MKLSKEIKIGIITVIALLSFFWVFTFLQGRNMFTPGRVFYVKYNNVDGLLPTKPVNINGLKVGSVENIEIVEKDKNLFFIVKLIVENDIEFSKNTIAEIYEPGLMQGKMIQLKLDYNGPIAQDGDTLVASSNTSLFSSISDKIKPTQSKIDSVLINLNTTLKNYNSIADSTTVSRLKHILYSLDNSIQAMETTAKSIASLSDNTNLLIKNSSQDIKQLTKSTNHTIATAGKTIDKYGEVADKINGANLDETLKNLNSVTYELKNTLAQLNKSNGTINQLITNPSIYNNLESTTKKLDILIQDLQKRPDRYLQFSVFGKKSKEIKN